MVIMKIFINTWQLFLIWRCRIIYSNFSHLSYADGTVKWSRIHKLANFTMERNLQDTVTVILHQRLLYEVAIICRSRSLQRAMTKKKERRIAMANKKNNERNSNRGCSIAIQFHIIVCGTPYILPIMTQSPNKISWLSSRRYRSANSTNLLENWSKYNVLL